MQRKSPGLVLWLLALLPVAALAAPSVDVRLPAKFQGGPQMGRLLLMFAPVDQAPGEEPRALVNWDGEAIPFFGLDVRNWKPGTTRRIDDTA